MEGVTTALVGFVFVCIVFPGLVRHRPPFYMAFVAVALILLFAALGTIIGGTFAAFASAVVMLLNLAGFVLLVMATGGLSLGELAGQITSALGSMRGEEPRTTVVPLSKPAKAPAATAPKPAEEEERTVYVIDGGTPAAPAQQPKKQDTGPIPLE